MSIHHVQIGVSDLARSVDFYRNLLDLGLVDTATGRARLSAGPVLLDLVEAEHGDLGGWVNDDLQRGVRHLGFKVGDVDLRAQRVREAGVPFTLPPLDAVGGVRIAFFQDPDGTHLEIIDKYLQYHVVSSAELAARERAAALARPRESSPVFDHVAVTAADLDATLTLYRDTLGYEMIGQITQEQDPRGFVLTYLQAGDAVLEIFTFTAPMMDDPGEPDATRLGVRHVGITADAAGPLADPDGVPLRVRRAW